MRKRQSRRELSREYSQRKALLVSLAKSLFLRGRIQTTEAKAKEAARF
ncbi:MAG: 50S ribosomal protein L17, partial [Candidatus Wildermuthbacteria bacterium]|nr:50S ribosomal protein L17 [Candidatus Wildermuthbacteria bacterium]